MDSIYDYLYLIFPKVLKEAMEQGLYKEYVTRNNNESYIKGRIDISKFIKDNIPYNGRINYITREYTCNNKLFYLLRWTIEIMKKKPMGRAVLNSKKIKQFIVQIEYLTQDYDKYDLKSLIIINEKKIISHPYYNKYKQLQILCLKILKNSKIKYGNEDDDTIYGCLFDVSILWEEYINVVLEQYELGFIHSSNISKKFPIYMFQDSNEQPRYIDFYDDNKGMLIDAKYKRIEKNNRNDYNQMAAYMFLKKYKKSILLYPESNQSTYDKKVFNINSYGGNVYKISINIPSSNKYDNYNDYVKQMEKREELLIDLIKKIGNANI